VSWLGLIELWQYREQRRLRLIKERNASHPGEQYKVQVSEMLERIWDAGSIMCGSRPIGRMTTFEEEALEFVKKCWMKQGIWKNEWGDNVSGVWKHKEPLELESQSETDSEAESLSRLLLFSPKQPQPKPRRLESDEEKRRIAQRLVIREREREASRPYHQFVYQISKERERIIKDESKDGEGTGTADINTRAYRNVKATRIWRGIWNLNWDMLPRMS
jgi:hypothetical protein